MPGNFLLATLFLLGVVLFRYFLLVGFFWLAFYQRGLMAHRRIYRNLPSIESQRVEIGWSLLNGLIFAIVGAGLGLLWQKGCLQLYLRLDEHGWWYLPVSLLLASILHEIYFYLTHRWMHLPRVFRLVHSVHHQSREPSPWASFSFHPLEGLIQAAALPLILLVLPMHPVVLLLYLTLMTLSAIVNHLGIEVLPPGAMGKFLGSHLVSGLHHARHHQIYRYNFCLYFPAIDRWFGTEDPTFEAKLGETIGHGRKPHQS